MTTIDPAVIANAAATKKTYDTAVIASHTPIKAWNDALVALKLVLHPMRRLTHRAAPIPPPSTVTTADLPHLADAKLAAEAAVIAAKAANDTAQAAVKQALAVAGVL